MRIATVIVMFTLVLEWITPVLYEITFLVNHPLIIRTTSFVLLTTLVLLLLWSLLLTLLPMENAEREVSSTGRHLDEADRRRGRTTKRNTEKES